MNKFKVLLQRKYRLSVFILSVLILFILYLIYFNSIEDNYEITSKEYYNFILDEKKNYLKSTVDGTIDSIDLEIKERNDFFKESISEVDDFFERINIYEDYRIVSFSRDTNIISPYVDNESIKYVLIDNSSEKILSTNDPSFDDKDTCSLSATKDKDFYKYSSITTHDNSTLIVGVKKIDIDNEVKDIVISKIKSMNTNLKDDIWVEKVNFDDSSSNFTNILTHDKVTEEELKYLREYQDDVYDIITSDSKGGFVDEVYNTELQMVDNTISYIRLYENYDWIVGTSMSIEDINAQTLKTRKAYQKNINRFMMESMTVAFLVAIIIILNEFLRSRADVLNRKATMEREIEINQAHYDLMEKKYDDINEINHDFKNHLIVIEGLLDNCDKDSALNYIKDLHFSDKSTLNQVLISKNKVIDIILNDKIDTIKQNNIKFTHDIENLDFDFIQSIDISIILGNIMNNAIESSMKSSSKFIDLKIYSHNNFIVTRLKNSSDNKPVIENGKLLSTKANPELHGYGLENAINSINKYSGNLTYKYNESDKEFLLVIIIPIPSK